MATEHSPAPAAHDLLPWVRWVAVLGAAGFVILGLWAFLAPASFFDTLATFEPYNVHFIRDIGAFQVGLGAVLLLVTLLPDARAGALLGVGVGGALHAVGHVLDRDLGGSPASDIPTFTLLTVVLIVAGLAQLRATR
ncbi:MAG: hypothetical protein WD225_14130 [Ilumatobacteraceae bacterium]